MTEELRHQEYVARRPRQILMVFEWAAALILPAMWGWPGVVFCRAAQPVRDLLIFHVFDGGERDG